MKAKVRVIYHRAVTLIEHFHPDIIAAYAAGATLFIIISFFPFMIMLLSLLQFLPLSHTDFDYIGLDFVPATIQSLIVSMIQEIADNTSAVVLPIAAITGLWSASTGMLSLLKGLNVVYKREETRRYLVVRGLCMFYTVLFLLILVAVLAVLVFGSSLYHWLIKLFPFISTSLLKVINWRSLTALIVLTLFFTLLYKTVPNTKKSRWFGEVPGALFTAIGWMGFSYLYSVYISGFGRFSGIYGSLTAVVLLMIWLYACIYILFIGAYINVLLQHGRASNWLYKQPK